MIKKFLYLEWKAFIRSASFGTNLAMKILMGIMALYFTVIFLAAGIGGFFLLRDEAGLDPLETVNRYLIYYFIGDLLIRLLLQKMPVMNIRPMLVMPIRRKTIVHFTIGKTFLSFFTTLHLFAFVPFIITMLVQGVEPVGVVFWTIAVFALVLFNDLLAILMNNKDNLFYAFLALVAGLAASQYYGIFNVTDYTVHFYHGFFQTQWMWIIPVALFAIAYQATFRFLVSELYLDAGLASKSEVVTVENLTWLNRFGKLGTFLKNDIKLIKRNKRSKGTIFASIMFLFYGLLFYTGSIEAYDNTFMHMFAGIFVSGGFLFTFGQFVPSWDSAYYPLMMTQNIPYREYLRSKWFLIVVATGVSAILASFYIYFGWQIYRMILIGAIYNIGVNSHLVLLGGAFTKTPIDLASTKGAFGNNKSFNVKTMLISIPKLLVPVLLYGIGNMMAGETAALVLVGAVGVVGFLMRNWVFMQIEKIYKREKYSTLDAYKQKN